MHQKQAKSAPMCPNWCILTLRHAWGWCSSGYFGFGKARGLDGACPSQGWQKPWHFCWKNSTKSNTDQALTSMFTLAKMFARMCRLPGLVELLSANLLQLAGAL
jgi:hypothetical protein